MIVVIDTDGRRSGVREADDLARLSATLEGGGPLEPALRTFGLPDADADHVWIEIGWLRKTAAPNSAPEWHDRFDAMIAYAQRKGWINETGSLVRVHLSRP